MGLTYRTALGASVNDGFCCKVNYREPWPFILCFHDLFGGKSRRILFLIISLLIFFSISNHVISLRNILINFRCDMKTLLFILFLGFLTLLHKYTLYVHVWIIFLLEIPTKYKFLKNRISILITVQHCM